MRTRPVVALLGALLLVVLAAVVAAVVHARSDVPSAQPTATHSTVTRTSAPTSEPAGPGGNDPAAALERFFRALAKGDCAAVKQVVVGPEQIDCGFIGEASGSMDGIDLDAATYTVTDSGDDTATVRADFGGADKQDLDLVRTDGVWLVIFDTAA